MDSSNTGQPLALPEVTTEVLEKLEQNARDARDVVPPARRGLRWSVSPHGADVVVGPSDAPHAAPALLIAPDPRIAPAVTAHVAAADPLQVLALVAEVRSLREALAVSQAQTAEARELAESFPKDFVALEDWVPVCAPFLEVALARLAGRSYEPIPRDVCERFLRAFGQLKSDPPRSIEVMVEGGDPGSHIPGVTFRAPTPADALAPNLELEKVAPEDMRARPTAGFGAHIQINSNSNRFKVLTVEEAAQQMEQRPDLVAMYQSGALEVARSRLRLVEHNLATITRREEMTVRALDDASVPALVETRPGFHSAFPDDRVRWLAKQAHEQVERLTRERDEAKRLGRVVIEQRNEAREQRNEARRALTLEQQVGAAHREAAEDLRRWKEGAEQELARVQGLPEMEWAQASSVIAQGLALHARTDQPAAKQMLEALDQATTYVGRLKARAEAAEADNAALKDLLRVLHAWVENHGGKEHMPRHLRERLAVATRDDTQKGNPLLERLHDLEFTVKEMELNRLESINITTRREYQLLERLRAAERVVEAAQPFRMVVAMNFEVHKAPEHMPLPVTVTVKHGDALLAAFATYDAAKE